MPTYEYECMECKHRFEMFQNMNDEPINMCSQCNGKVKRLIGAGAGIIFKGSGFYVNDYKKSSSATSSVGSDKTSSNSTSEKSKSDSSSSSNSGKEKSS
ncbi:MAG: zinc ribbon domain-containing protein [archaeon]|nr:zinc ribbon domain-containing protein [archaeon]